MNCTRTTFQKSPEIALSGPRYSSITTDVEASELIDRNVADSRARRDRPGSGPPLIRFPATFRKANKD